MTTLNKIKKDIISTVQKAIKDDEIREHIYNSVKTILKSYHQKPLGKRFYKDLNFLIPDAYLKSIGSMLSLEIPEKHISEKLGHETS